MRPASVLQSAAPVECDPPGRGARATPSGDLHGRRHGACRRRRPGADQRRHGRPGARAAVDRPRARLPRARSRRAGNRAVPQGPWTDDSRAGRSPRGAPHRQGIVLLRPRRVGSASASAVPRRSSASRRTATSTPPSTSSTAATRCRFPTTPCARAGRPTRRGRYAGWRAPAPSSPRRSRRYSNCSTAAAPTTSGPSPSSSRSCLCEE